MPEQIVEWDDANITKLKLMWDAGKSASEIASAIPFCTRSAVLGKASRLKLAPRSERNMRAIEQPVQKTVQSVLDSERLKRIASKPAKAVEPPPSKHFAGNIVDQIKINATEPEVSTRLQQPGDSNGIPLLELTNNTCRWPMGDPLEDGFLFCGETAANLEEHRPYCPFHTAKSIASSRSPREFERSTMYATRQR